MLGGGGYHQHTAHLKGNTVKGQGTPQKHIHVHVLICSGCAKFPASKVSRKGNELTDSFNKIYLSHLIITFSNTQCQLRIDSNFFCEISNVYYQTQLLPLSFCLGEVQVGDMAKITVI